MNNNPERRSGEVEGISEQVESIKAAEFHQLDPLAIRLWRIEVLPFVGIASLVALIGGSVLWIFLPVPALQILIDWTILACLFLVMTLWLPPRKYVAWSYRANDQMLELRFGIFWQTSVMIPLSRLQHVDMSRGPFERHLGLASLEVHTAGTRAASHKIPCLKLETALLLRNQLISAADLSIENDRATSNPES